jgi:glucose/mannose transport system substrate-binding protein
MNRKHILLAALMLVSMLLAACAGTATPTQAPAATAAPTQPPAAQAGAGGKLEVFSWWTSGGEADALNALFNEFKKLNPTAEIINATVAGGGGSNARAVLQTRLAGGNPPDTWQVHPGYELLGQYVAAGYVDPITDLYKSEGWDKVIPQGLIDQMTKDGQIYGVLAGIHRGNGLWYNKNVLDKLGITVGPTMSLDEFFQIAEKVKAAGITPLCVGDNGVWASAQLFENTLLGVIGPEKYKSLWNGTETFDAPEVKQAMDAYGKMLDYQNADHSSLSWDQAIKKLMEGSCVFSSMGDWAYGEFVKAGLKDNVDFGWVSHPGTAGSFMVVADGFVMAHNAPDHDNNILWLKAIGSKEGQEAFNPLKGSIPARTDVDRSKFGVYHNWSMDSFAKDTLTPSVVHGSAAPADFQQALNDAVTTFIVDKNVDAFSTALVTAAKTSGFAN